MNMDDDDLMDEEIDLDEELSDDDDDDDDELPDWHFMGDRQLARLWFPDLKFIQGMDLIRSGLAGMRQEYFIFVLKEVKVDGVGHKFYYEVQDMLRSLFMSILKTASAAYETRYRDAASDEIQSQKNTCKFYQKLLEDALTQELRRWLKLTSMGLQCSMTSFQKLGKVNPEVKKLLREVMQSYGESHVNRVFSDTGRIFYEEIRDHQLEKFYKAVNKSTTVNLVSIVGKVKTEPLHRVPCAACENLMSQHRHEGFKVFITMLLPCGETLEMMGVLLIQPRPFELYRIGEWKRIEEEVLKKKEEKKRQQELAQEQLKQRQQQWEDMQRQQMQAIQHTQYLQTIHQQLQQQQMEAGPLYKQWGWNHPQQGNAPSQQDNGHPQQGDETVQQQGGERTEQGVEHAQGQGILHNQLQGTLQNLQQSVEHHYQQQGGLQHQQTDVVHYQQQGTLQHQQSGTSQHQQQGTLQHHQQDTLHQQQKGAMHYQQHSIMQHKDHDNRQHHHHGTLQHQQGGTVHPQHHNFLHYQHQGTANHQPHVNMPHQHQGTMSHQTLDGFHHQQQVAGNHHQLDNVYKQQEGSAHYQHPRVMQHQYPETLHHQHQSTAHHQQQGHVHHQQTHAENMHQSNGKREHRSLQHQNLYSQQNNPKVQNPVLLQPEETSKPDKKAQKREWKGPDDYDEEVQGPEQPAFLEDNAYHYPRTQSMSNVQNTAEQEDLGSENHQDQTKKTNATPTNSNCSIS